MFRIPKKNAPLLLWIIDAVRFAFDDRSARQIRLDRALLDRPMLDIFE